MTECEKSPISVTDADENGVKHYLSGYPDTMSAEIGGLYEEPTPWLEMTPEQKGALLLAHCEGKPIQMVTCILDYNRMVWKDVSDNWKPRITGVYRIKPKVETVTMYGFKNWRETWSFWSNDKSGCDTYSITFNLINGEPDTASIKMEPTP